MTRGYSQKDIDAYGKSNNTYNKNNMINMMLNKNNNLIKNDNPYSTHNYHGNNLHPNHTNKNQTIFDYNYPSKYSSAGEKNFNSPPCNDNHLQPQLINPTNNNSKPIQSSDNINNNRNHYNIHNTGNHHFNNIYFSHNNPKEIPTTNRIEMNKTTKSSYNSTGNQGNNFNASTKKLNNPHEIGERLYKKAFQIQGKLEKIRKEVETKRIKGMTPELSPVAKKIKRDPKKFHERLYPGNTNNATANKTLNNPQNSNPQEVQIINTVMDIGFFKEIEKNYQSERINHNYNSSINNNSNNNSIKPNNIHEKNNFESNNNQTPLKNEEECLNIIPDDNFSLNANSSNRFHDDNNHIQNEKQLDDNQEQEYLNKIYRKNKEKSDYYTFDHKPKLNKNSLKIAEQLTPAKERLVSKKKRTISPSPDRTYRADRADKTERTASKLKMAQNFENFSNFSYISDDGYNPITHKKRSRSPTPTNRVKELYHKGLEQMKKLESLCDQKKKMEEEEYKKFTFKPKIIKNSPVLICKISGDYDKLNKSSENNTKENDKTKHDMYEKQLNWKKNIENNTKRLKKTFDDEKNKNLSFKPIIHKKIPENDEKFIMKNLGQIEEYVNRRRNNIQKQKDEEEYKKKIFPNGENFKSKPTVAKEFKFKTDERSRSRSQDRSRSREPSNNSRRNVKMMRKKINAGDFFEIPNQDEVNEKFE
jgi:hypothetical protein